MQMALFGLLVWLPRIVLGSRDADTLNEAAISFMLAASGWVMATVIARRHAAVRSETGGGYQGHTTQKRHPEQAAYGKTVVR